MNNQTEAFETLKQILRNVRDPAVLDDHPWTRSLIVQEALRASPELAGASPGQQLVGAILGLFPRLQPASPPRRGKRLDPRWGEFGLLAAMYFAPFNHGRPYPTSLADAWARIDEAILHFVFGGPVEALGEDDVRRYELVGADVDYAAASTLSDWHRKGIERFSEVVLDRERYLARGSSEPSIILDPEGVGLAAAEARRKRMAILKRGLLVFGLLAILLLSAAGYKGWRIYEAGMLVYSDLTHLRALTGGRPGLTTLEAAVPAMRTLQRDLAAFEAEARPVLLLAPRLGWVPMYGADIASAPALLETADRLLSAALHSHEAAQPLLGEFGASTSALDPAGLTSLLVDAQPGLEKARRELDLARSARAAIDAGSLSPRLQSLLVGEVDPVIALADEGLRLAAAVPGILGAASDGPKTYLLLPQNEDELRPTGGFITSVGNLVLRNGEVIRLDFESVDNDQLDWTLPYPLAPWQLREYMNSNVLILRDANWFTDFPTTVLWAEYLYAYTHAHSVDGVIAFDQQFLVMLLGEIGPLDVEGVDYPITKDNVIQYMRSAKVPAPDEPLPPNWYRKEFISKLAAAVLESLTAGDEHDWPAIASVLTRALQERHLLLQFDDPVFTELIAERGWDNAVRPPEEGDYLMVADTNIGFNKTNAVVDVSLDYDVDLTDPAAPVGRLFVIHANNAQDDVPCLHWSAGQLPAESDYPINRCYWNYLRVYKQDGVGLLDATPHSVPGDWLIGRQGIPARVDRIEDEVPGASTFGTLIVVPGGEWLNTGFEFSLPGVLIAAPDDSGDRIYRLRVQKQPGTLAIPLTVRVHLPRGAALVSTSARALAQDNSLLFKLDLRTDVELEIRFSLR